MSDPGNLQSPPGSISDNLIVNNQSTGSSFVQSEPRPRSKGPAGGRFGFYHFGSSKSTKPDPKTEPKVDPKVQAAKGSVFSD